MLKQEAFQKMLQESGDKLVVVNFTATWCVPCRTIFPVFVDLSEQPDNKNVVFLKVDVDRAPVSACGVLCTPLFQFYKAGDKGEFTGADADQLNKLLTEWRNK
uniref:Thioredoxin domain-containing protein n=1 Tax=Oryzias melastigma TaxID=30732 RepID=A0A3B3D775_ORYME